MSELRSAKSGDLRAFPGSKFVIQDTPPITQCQETQIAGDRGFTGGLNNRLRDNEKFVGIDLTGKILTITSPPGNAGDYTVLSNIDRDIFVDTDLTTNSNDNVYTVHDPGQTYLTRNQSSFLRFIAEEDRAYTIKGGVLFTDVPDPPMEDACSDTFAPL